MTCIAWNSINRFNLIGIELMTSRAWFIARLAASEETEPKSLRWRSGMPCPFYVFYA
jgi:hypothetical protein